MGEAVNNRPFSHSPFSPIPLNIFARFAARRANLFSISITVGKQTIADWELLTEDCWLKTVIVNDRQAVIASGTKKKLVEFGAWLLEFGTYPGADFFQFISQFMLF